MKAIVLEQHGGIESLQIKEIPTPQPDNKEILVKIHATALNRADILQRKGLYPGPQTEYEIPGLEFSGIVVTNGSNANLYEKGDAIMGIVASGSYAEYLTVHERQVMPVPENLTLSEAAGIPEAWFTAFDALIDKGNLQNGDTCLIHAGASGVGTAAIQIAKNAGAKVAVTASTQKIGICRELGAELTIDYTEKDFVEETRHWSDNQGVNVIIDLVGGDYLAKNLESLAPKGTIVQVGLMGTGKPEIDLGIMLRKRANLIGTVLRSRTLEEKIDLTEKFSKLILPKFTNGEFKVYIDSVYSLENTAEAHTRMEQNHNIGKIIIEIP
ncbi:MAG: NAD(P)H-quinone oxidoreductase [Acidimicrobiales bacterium]|jgi:putative PIG3 family NAD(P)H quinone oxidoreductase|nr:NAD(P)H-quinone oxidoreductase [Acidimicrobiales bacterium]HJM27488.1 NAD(P)H-quinone oxidoreductase [Acidimicrobiales bacterium]